MKIVIASQNPVKLAAVQQAFTTYFENDTFEFVTVNVSSGVNDQPLSADETAQGACTRAMNAKQDGADFAVGIEGGISFVTVKDKEHAFEQNWACVLDCKTTLHEIASGPAFPIPPHLLAHMREGKNLTDAMALEYGTADIGKKDGYNGWLSKNHINRASASYQAVFLALCGLLREET